MWDRRQGDRRNVLDQHIIGVERRRRERRGRMPAVWDTLGILMVAVES
jgi:hypothetical protein